MNVHTADNELTLRARNLRTVGLLAGLFVLPLALSFWLYYGLHWHPAGMTNHGELIEPPRPLPALPAPPRLTVPGSPAELAREAAPETLFRARWTLVYIGDGACDAHCRDALYFMRQTRLSLNNDMTRVRRVFLATGAAPDEGLLAREFAGLTVVRIQGPQLTQLLAQFPARDQAHSLYVVDPLGNLMMRYDARRSPKGLLEDLKKLLQLSHIG